MVFLAGSTIGGTSIRRKGISDIKVHAKVLQAASYVREDLGSLALKGFIDK
jgi:hypothetical protein